jgi:hypothetical protein
LAPGRYHVGIAVGTGDYSTGLSEFDIVLDVCHFEVLPLEGDGGTLATWSPTWGSVQFEDIRCHQIETTQLTPRGQN